jgi:aryl-alcohol dehydrogenase-like predicted oxidoreductase
MRKKVFGRTGLIVSELGFGGAPIGYLHTDPNHVARMLNMLLDAGVNVIDTAPSYQWSERSIQLAVGHRRDEFILVSKCGAAFASDDAPRWSNLLIERSIDHSLSTLKTDYIDVMLLHSCPTDVLRKGDAIEALARARQTGKIRYAGYSGDNEAAAYAATLSDLSVLEISLNLCDQANLSSAIPIAHQQALGVMAKRPVANAAWNPLFGQQSRYGNDYAQGYSERLARMVSLNEGAWLRALSRAEWAELAIRFTISHPDVHTSIVGSADPEHVLFNLNSVSKGPLPPEEFEALRKLYSEADEDGLWVGQV